MIIRENTNGEYMIYKNVVNAKFIKRLNRFTAMVSLNDREILVHIKNTGRLKELLVADANVILEKSENTNRKTEYDLVSVYKGDRIVNIDSQILNFVAFNEISRNNIVKNASNVKREVTYKNSRFDLFFEIGNQKCFIEVKGVNLVKNNIAMFPDAPTERGAKHILELIDATKNGYKSYILFLVALDYVEDFTINTETDENFYRNLKMAIENGVEVLVYNLKITENDIILNKKINFII